MNNKRFALALFITFLMTVMTVMLIVFLVFIVNDSLRKASIPEGMIFVCYIFFTIIFSGIVGLWFDKKPDSSFFDEIKKKKKTYSFEEDMRQNLIDHGNIISGEGK